MKQSDISKFSELYDYLANLIDSGKLTFEDIKRAVENMERMEDDRK